MLARTKKKWFTFKPVIDSIINPGQMEPIDMDFKEVPNTKPKELLVQDALAGLKQARLNNSHLFDRGGFKTQ